MLIVEEIKQAVKFADITSEGSNKAKTLFYEIKIVLDSLGMIPFTDDLYDLFLDRVIQGMNRAFDSFDIETTSKFCKIRRTEDNFIVKCNLHNGTTVGIREAREKAIRFVLKEGV